MWYVSCSCRLLSDTVLAYILWWVYIVFLAPLIYLQSVFLCFSFINLFIGLNFIVQWFYVYDLSEWHANIATPLKLQPSSLNSVHFTESIFLFASMFRQPCSWLSDCRYFDRTLWAVYYSSCSWNKGNSWIRCCLLDV